MKKVKVFGLLMAMIMTLGFTACTEDDDDAIISISVVGDVAESVSVNEEVIISYNVISDNKLDVIKYIANNETIETIEDFTNPESHTGAFTVPTDEIGSVNASIIVTDKDGQVETKTFTIEVESNIATYEAVLLGSQDSETLGSFYSTVTNEVYTIADAAENSDLIDFVYFYGSSRKATIGAPDDEVGVQDVFGTVANWETKNNTLFNLADLQPDEFYEITDSSELIELTADSQGWINRVTFLAEGDIVEFVTVDGKSGVFIVTSIEGETYGSESKITIEVKIEK